VPCELRSPGQSLRQMIAAYRLRHGGCSQEDLALACGMYQSHISAIENNKKHPQFSTLLRICNVLALSQQDRMQLFCFGGYQAAFPLPYQSLFRIVLPMLVPILESYVYLPVLSD